MPLLFRLTSYLIFSLNGLLLFLWFYVAKLSIPNWLQPIGRMHPMILHLPIGFFVMAIIVLILKSQFKPKVFKSTLQLTFILTALSLAVTALVGIILSREGGYDDETLTDHLNSGVVLSAISAIIAGTTFRKKISLVQYSLTGIGFVLLIITGHFGATLTHGESYLLGNSYSSPNDEILESDSITLFSKAVLPVLEKKCTSCHNPKKKKGELILTSEADILKGGENGAIIDTSNPEESELLKRIHLELEHDDHMPPSGKPQLTSLEIDLFQRWIAKGADFKVVWKSIPESDSLALLANRILVSYEKKKAGKTYDFDFVSGDKIESLNSPFRTVSQISADAPALKAGFYLSQYFTPDDLKSLSDIKTQLVELNLAGMPITDKDVSYIAEFENLESLNLNNTGITNEGLGKLSSLSQLQRLSLAGTKINSTGLSSLNDLQNLKEVFLWNTSISNLDLESLKKQFPDVLLSMGFQPSKKEILKLTPPILKNEVFLLKQNESIVLKHNLPGTTIRYTLDGTDPDSTHSQVYSEPITIINHSTLKTIAFKDGWQKSNTMEYNFFVAGITPVQTQLLSTANKDYKAKGANSLIDGILGDPDNFRDGNWLGFRESSMVSLFSFTDSQSPKDITIIYSRNIGSYLMPPESVEIWAGDNKDALKLIAKLKPDQPVEYLPNKLGSISYQFSKPFSVVKIVASPVQKLPKWHSGKGEKGWLMVSEIIFN